MSKEILIHINKTQKRVAILEDGKLDDFHIEDENQQSILGNIYKGRVESILPSINGAFVNIGQERNGFLYLTDTVNPLLEEEMPSPRKIISKILGKKEEKEEEKAEAKPDAKPQILPLKEGQEILVQVVKDPFAAKGARLTTHVTLAGRFVVYMPFDPHTGISKKIENVEERNRLRDVLKSFTFAKSGGFIVRTASKEQGKGELTRDAKFLSSIWYKIKKKADAVKSPALIYKDFNLISRVVRDYLTEDVERVIIDSPEDFQKLRKFVFNFIGRHMVNRIELHKGTVPLFDVKKVSNELKKIYDPRIHLRSGAHIVIEPTEALTVVDVNSGKFKTDASPEEAAFQVNMEAASELARQLRLRDLGGIIVIDFIDMTRENHRRKVLDALKQALTKDHSKTEVSRFSALGLVEMTRARAGKTVESISFENCPYCEGRGRIKRE